MRLYEKVARTLAKHTNGEWEKYEDIRSLENFCKGLEEMGNTQVLRHMVSWLDKDDAREYDPKYWVVRARTVYDE